MNRHIVLVAFVALMFTLGNRASAQLVAGSPEDKLYQQIIAADNPADKEKLCLNFESQFSESDVVVDIYIMLMEIHGQRNDDGKVVEYGEKAITKDPANISALMTVSRTLAVARRLLPKAVSYAERAVAAAAALREKSPPPQYTEEQWMQYVQATERAARSILSYARSISG